MLDGVCFKELDNLSFDEIQLPLFDKNFHHLTYDLSRDFEKRRTDNLKEPFDEPI